ncbi:MAG: C4-dicarboxylate ABC transporter substrate-binding protein [Oceanospirillaceae bacterium]|nr:C4-dicarboxylate ABC transporter substrate-binding protein [Oceanospirillaceae bacterium]
MSAKATILTDDSLLSRIDQMFFRLESALTLVGGVIILALVFLAVTNVLGRWIFSLPVDGYIDWVEQSMALMAFLGLSFTQRQGGHIRMDILIGQLRGRYLWFVEALSTLVMLILSLLLTYGTYLHFLRAWTIGDTSLDINLPTWPAKLVVPIAMSVLSLRLIAQLWGYVRAFVRNDEEPVAVPLVEDAATVAAREAESVSRDLINREEK